jgi:hypothetical protein
MKRSLFPGFCFPMAWIFGILLAGYPIQAQTSMALPGSESHLVVKVHDMTLTDYNRLVETIAREPDMTLEYGCVEFGILALKLKHNLLPAPDIKAYVVGRIAPALAGKQVEVLHLETHETAAGRC